MKMNGPVVIEIKVLLTDGTQQVEATYVCPAGMFPTADFIQHAMDAAMKQVQETLGNGNWRLANKREFWDFIMEENTGTDEKFALPGSEEWDKPETGRVKELEELLTWLHRKGGLGLDVHDRIQATLDKK